MNKPQLIETVCRKIFPQKQHIFTCKEENCDFYPRNHKKCFIKEKTVKQLEYIISSAKESIFLKACPGSGKTEVVGLKAAFEFQTWAQKHNGIAILTFTNNAADVIKERVQQFAGIKNSTYPHFIGTIDSWLHGYLAHPFGHLITGYIGKEGDRSIRVVEDSVSEGWINNYKCQTSYSFIDSKNNLRTMPLFANNLRYDVENKCWEIKKPASGEYQTDEDYYKSTAFQSFISDKSWLTLERMQNGLGGTKQKFLQDGFATYQDIEWICFRLLKERNGFAEKLSQRFPFIIVDECQDLSWIQLEILSLIKRCGTSLHFVGDLNQAIYEFKKVDPQKVNDFISHHNFELSRLSDNFRSCQTIVDLCEKLVKGEDVVGRQPTPQHEPCICFQYKKEDLLLLPYRFERYLDEKGIDIKKSAILTRGWSLIYKLNGFKNTQTDKPPFQIATAIYLWSKNKIGLLDQALKLLGRFISTKYFNDKHQNSRQYYCPSTIESSMRWRFFLAQILDECLKSNYKINDLKMTWEDWAKCIRANNKHIIKSCLFLLQQNFSEEQFNKISFISPRGFGKKRVVDTLMSREIKKSSIKTETIHSIKGKTFDAVLVVSSPDARGSKGGYWEEWLKDLDSEPARFSYVASSRPRVLLAWAIPETSDLTKIKQLGFKIMK